MRRFYPSLYMETKDSNGNLLNDGDAVTLIKDLKVKGSSQTLKRGTVVKNIRLTNSPAEVEGRAGGSMMVLRTEFLKKA
ncbi:PhnA protein [Hymenobacter sp. CRA2]|nr:PhnA protein [Hymenobacter sp. CRA2]